MNEVQGPTPTGTSRPYRSLPEALRAHRVSLANYEFITAVVNVTGVSSLIDRGRYIEAIRLDGAPLHIGKTYTNGFTEDEQIVIGGTTVKLQPSEGRPPFFYVTHPSEFHPPSRTAGRRAGAARTTPKVAPRAPKLIERDYGACEVCFMVRNATGACGCE